MSEKFITIRLPQNLRNSWTYPNLLHFEKYVDLLLLSASEKRESYNKTFVYIKPGNVLLKYSFFSFRWKVSHKVCRSIFNVLSIAGWIKIKNVDCRSISNRKINVPLITFPKTGYDNGMVIVNVIGGNKVGTVVSDSITTSYNDKGQQSGNSREDSKEDGKETIKVDLKSTGREDGREDGGDNSYVGITNEELDRYEDMIMEEARNKDSGKDSGKEALIIIDDDDDIYKKEKYKKEKLKNPSLEEVEAFAMKHNISPSTAHYFYNFYSASDWKDKSGEPIGNWKTLLVKLTERKKYEIKNIKPSATDKLARQAAELASHYAGTLAGEEK